MDLKELRTQLLKEAQRIAETARDQGRELTDVERKAVDDALTRVDTEIDPKLKQAEEDQALVQRLQASGRQVSREQGLDQALGWGVVDQGFLRGLGGKAGAATAKAIAMRTAGHLSSDVTGRKALVGGGSSLVGVQLDPNVIELGQPATGLLDVLPGQRREVPTYRFLRQSVRTNNAAVVAAGSAKPTSVYTITSVDATLQVVAHMSEAFDKYLLGDATGLNMFIRNEMLYGLRVAVEALALTTIAGASGIQLADFVDDILTTTRGAVTDLELDGVEGAFWALHPTDWEQIELTKASGTGDFQMGPQLPIDRASRRLWSVPVVTSAALTPGVGYLVASDAAALSTDGQIEFTWGAINDDFEKNQLRARLESRYHLDVTRPWGIVQVQLDEES